MKGIGHVSKVSLNIAYKFLKPRKECRSAGGTENDKEASGVQNI